MNQPVTRSIVRSHFPDLSEADRCVKCGLCLPHCPTFVQTGREAESPRGRLALMIALGDGTLEQSSALESHLDLCLGCRECERLCPADVPYGALLDVARQELNAGRPARRRLQWLDRMLIAPGWRRTANRLLRLLFWSQLIAVARLLPGAAGRLSQLAARPTPIPDWRKLTRRDEPAPRHVANEGGVSDGGRPRVTLFKGCAGELFDAALLADCVWLLGRLGFDVDVPADQACCGAIAQHAGDLDQAAKLAATNLRSLPNDRPVVCAATGCSATLAEYHLHEDLSAQNAQLNVVDIERFIARHLGQPSTGFAAPRVSEERVLVHVPCSLRNVRQDASAATDLLRHIPGLTIDSVNQGCCGGAGRYFVDQAAMSDDLADNLLQRILKQLEIRPVDRVVTSNIGCRLQLQAGLRRHGLNIPVEHPVQVLARQYRPAGAPTAA